MNNLHIPILTLIERVNKMKVNLDGLPLEYHARIMNTNINNDLESIVKELQVILAEVQTYNTNTLDGYNKDDADLFLGRNLDIDEWYELKEELLRNDILWDQIAEFADDWMTDNIIAKENNNETE